METGKSSSTLHRENESRAEGEIKVRLFRGYSRVRIGEPSRRKVTAGCDKGLKFKIPLSK